MALLLTKEKRESWTGLMSGLSAYYQSPGRLAVLRRRFESAFRRPGLDPATFATELGILAIQGFEDMKEQARDTMIRDKFIAGQRQCALRRQLDGFAQDTPIGEIVDSCRVWESHSDSDRIATVNCESDVGNQLGDSRTREHMKSVANVQPNVVDIERLQPVVGNKEDPSVIEVLVNQLLQSTQGAILRKDRPSGHGAGVLFLRRRRSQDQPVHASECGLPFSTSGLVGEYGQWTVPSYTNEQKISGSAGKRAAVRAGGSASRAAGDQSSTDPGGGFRRNKQRKSNWRLPTEHSKRGATGRRIVRSFRPWKRGRGRSEIQRDRPVPVPPKWTGDRRHPRPRFPGIWTGGCGRLKTFGRSLRRTVIHGHGESRRS